VKALLHILLLGCIAMIGCATERGSIKMLEPPRPVDLVDRVTLMSLPTAVNLDQDPGPDAVMVQAHLFKNNQPAPVLVNGKLQFLLYENRVTRSELHALSPHLVWTYSGAKLERHKTQTWVGWGYSAKLRWGSKPPTSKAVSLAARYISDRGAVVYSSPVVISMR